MIISDEELLIELDRRFKENKKMLDEQKELSRELVIANRKLMESEALKTHFISSVTNEIINPFSSILGLSGNMLMVREGDWNKVRNMSRLIHSEAFSLDFQLRNIFTAANIEAGELSPEPSSINIIELLNSVADTFRHEAEKKNIKIAVEKNFSSGVFITDRDKLKLIISNLLSNAIKYNKDNGGIIITPMLTGSVLKVSIKDTGIGINEQFSEEIFDRFKRVDTQINSLNTGHGLGLSIVKSLAELLGGSIEIHSEPDKGSEFIVSIPESESDSNIYNLLDENDLNMSFNNEIF